MALTKDVFANRWGAEGKHEPLSLPLGSSATVYSGSIAATRSGYLAPISTPQSTDVVFGLIGEPAGGTYVKTGPGIVGNGSQGVNGVAVEVLTGSFILAYASGADAFAATDIGVAAYVVDEVTVGKTNGTNTRPQAGLVMALNDTDPTIPSGFCAVQFTNRGT